MRSEYGSQDPWQAAEKTWLGVEQRFQRCVKRFAFGGGFSH
jgi:hypothetical protein